MLRPSAVEVDCWVLPAGDGEAVGVVCGCDVTCCNAEQPHNTVARPIATIFFVFMRFPIFIIAVFNKIFPYPSSARCRLSECSSRVWPQSAGDSRPTSLQVLSD